MWGFDKIMGLFIAMKFQQELFHVNFFYQQVDFGFHVFGPQRIFGRNGKFSFDSPEKMVWLLNLIIFINFYKYSYYYNIKINITVYYVVETSNYKQQKIKYLHYVTKEPLCRLTGYKSFSITTKAVVNICIVVYISG